MDHISTIPKKIYERDDIWSPEEEAILIRMFNEGASQGDIGFVVDKSRGAVGGKISRLRAKGVITQQPLKKYQKKYQSYKSKPRTNSPLEIPSFLPTKPKRIRLMLNDEATLVTFADLQETDCKWIHGDPKRPDYRFCGKRRIKGSSYCQEHSVRAGQQYTNPK